MTRHRSALETYAAMDFQDRRTFQSVVYNVRLAGQGEAAANAYLAKEVASSDRHAVLRIARKKV